MPRGRRGIPKAVYHDKKKVKYVQGKYSLLTGARIKEYKIVLEDSQTLESIEVEELIAKKYHIEEDKIFLETPPFIVVNIQNAVEE